MIPTSHAAARGRPYGLIRKAIISHARPGKNPATKIFTAVINRNGLDRGYNHNYVKRNYVYRLNVTFGDTSFDGDHEKDPNIPIPPRPTTGDLDVQVEVVNWGQVNQDVEI